MAGDDAGAGGQAATIGAPAEFAEFYDATARAAFSLAYRITGERASAEQACAAAYVSQWKAHAGSRPQEAELLADVRDRALEARKASTATAGDGPADLVPDAVHSALESLGLTERRALDLVYFGGLRVDEAAELLAQPPSETRRALRAALLAVGRAVPAEGQR